MDPTADAWAEHFTVSRDEIHPLDGDADAAYTHETYDLNDSRKTARRRARRELVTDRMRLLGLLGEEINLALQRLDELREEDRARFQRVLRRVQSLREQGLRALSDLSRFIAIPEDAPSECRCKTTRHHVFPEVLAGQMLEVPDTLYPDLDLDRRARLT